MDGERRIRFTRAQQEVENLAEKALRGASQPVDPKTIRSAIFAANTPEHLADRLAVLLQGIDPATFGATLERALHAADVLGFRSAEES